LRLIVLVLPSLLVASACGRIADVGRAPDFAPIEETSEFYALYANPLPLSAKSDSPSDAASLWTASPASLLGDRRAGLPGDILTVVIEIDDKAEISNSTGRERSGDESLHLPDFFGLPQRIDEHLPAGASMADAVETSSESSFDGKGTTRRKEKLTLRVAVTVVERMPNGVLRIEGRQQVRVNFELRDLVVTGYVRAADISRQNEITYDKIAGAQIAYGGRGQITDVQQPRYGQQVADILLPF
jgi:flagellar L-ring protein precursor FlgH